jgi:hypothetical protein
MNIYIPRRTVVKLIVALCCVLFLASCGDSDVLSNAEELSEQALPGNASACFYADSNYGGASFCSSTNNPQLNGTWNNRVSSVRVESGYQVELFNNANYGGTVLNLTSNTANLASRNFNNLASSFKITKTGGGNLPAPPTTIVDRIREGNPTVTRVYYDDEIAVYFGAGMDRRVTWMNGYIRNVWKYMKKTYGYFGPDPRIYVVAHKNPQYDYATINTRFDSGFGYRNVIDLGGSWDWNNPEQVNYEVITHELAHIVEGGSKNTKESPSFEFWSDGPWPEIFIYDVYKALGRNAWAQDWFDRMKDNTNGHFFGDEEYYFFRDWFYPIYSKYGGAKVFDKYFALLSQCFPKMDIEVANGKTAKEYARRATFGEVLHFMSGAAGVNLKTQYTKAFGWDAKIAGEFSKAQRDFSCPQYPR